MDTVHLEGVLETPAGTALSGHISVELWEDGSWRSRFELHSSSLLEPFDVDVRAYVTAPNFPALAFRYAGHVPAKGHNAHPDESGNNPFVRLYWSRLKAGPQFTIRKEYSVGGVLGTIADVYDEIVGLTGGVVGAALGLIIGVTKDAVGWIGATLGPGVTLGLVGGVVVFAVAASFGIGVGAAALVGTFAAVVICVVTELLTDTRPLDASERALAQRVFGDTLPLDDIRLTNLGGSGGRGFTAQGIDGKIYCNLGKGFYRTLGGSDVYPPLPGMSDSYAYPGQLLIHELTHAWQIHNSLFLPALMCSMLVTQFEHSLVDDQYAYGPPGPAWGDLNPEQQASIVDQWYAGARLSDGWASMDQQNVYYRYIWDDVLRHGSPHTAPTTLRSSTSSPLATNTRRSVEPGDPASPGSRPSVVEHEDVFWIAGDGSLVRHGPSDDTGVIATGLPPATLSDPGTGSPDGPLAVLSRTPTTVEAFCIAPDGRVVSAAWSGQKAPPTKQVFTPITKDPAARAGSPLVAIARSPRQMDVFWAGADGAVTTAWWNADLTGVWTDTAPFAVTGPAAIQVGSGLAALSRLAQHIDVFWVGEDGAIQTQWWDGGVPQGGWADHLPFPISPPGAARLGSPVVTVSRVPDQIDVFWIGPDGSIMTQWWRAGAGTGWGDHAPFPIAPASSAGMGSGLSAVARTQQHLDVFWIAADNAVATQWWDGAPGCNWADHPFFPVAAAGAAHAGSPLSAVCRNNDRIDVCFVGSDGAIMAQWWGAGAGTGWADHAPQAVSPPGAIARDFETVKHAAAHLRQESSALADTGKRSESLDAIRRAIEVLMRADVTRAERNEFTRQVLLTQLDLAYRLLGGPAAQFVAAAHDAVLDGQQAVAAGNDAVTVAATLRTLSSWAAGFPAPQCAADTISAAAAILRAVAPADGSEAAYYRTLGLVTYDVFYRLITAGQPQLAVDPLEEAIQAYQRLPALGADVIEVTDSLMTWSTKASDVVAADASLAGMATAAIDAARAAVDLLMATDPSAGEGQTQRARLARAQLTLAERLIAAGRAGDAAESARAAVTLYEALVAVDAGYDGLLGEARGVVASLA